MDANNYLSYCFRIAHYSAAISIIVFALSVGVRSVAASESEEIDIIDLSLEDLLNVKVTSAAKITQKVSEASSVISVFNQTQIEQHGWQTLNHLLYSQPGFGPAQDYDRPTVATRGNFDSWSNNHILHLIDGVPFNDNLYGSAYTWLMPLFTSQTIEVIRGPGSALYGSNATNGVVQMNTLKAADLDEQSRIFLSFEDDNTKRVSALTGKVKDQFDFILGYSFHETDGNEYLSFDGSNRLGTLNDPQTNRPLSERFQTRDEKEDSYFWSKLSIGENWNIQYHRQEWDFETGHGWVFWIPDFDEVMQEQRDIFSIKYTDRSTKKLTQEYVFKYQKHAIQWDQRYYPNGAFADFYPTGMWEYLETDATDIFLRAQVTYFQPQTENTWLAGIEVDRFSYGGDKQHYSNVNVDSDFAEPFPGDVNMPLGPWLDFILDEPVLNTALYVQYNDAKFTSSDLALTVGLRWDKLSLDYQDIYDSFIKKEKKLSRLSPRIALIYKADANLSYKFFAGKAFRAPTPTEMAGAHTFSLASNIAELEAELVTTYELQADWTIDQNHILRSNLFWLNFENQIAYSTVNFNLSSNVYSTENAGIELEVLGNYDDWNWFANLSYTNRLDENILAFFIDENAPNAQPIPEFTEHASDLKWEPELKINAGVYYRYGDWDMSASLHYHGEVERRQNELGNPGGFLPLGVDVPLDYNLDDHRSPTIDAWTKLDLRLGYRISPTTVLGMKVENLLDTEAYLVKTGPFPFDYRINDRHLSIFLNASF